MVAIAPGIAFQFKEKKKKGKQRRKWGIKRRKQEKDSKISENSWACKGNLHGDGQERLGLEDKVRPGSGRMKKREDDRSGRNPVKEQL